MNAKPKRYPAGEPLKLSYLPRGLIFECEVTDPPSMTNRTIYVWFDEDDLTDAMLAMKRYAGEIRR